MVVVLTGGEQAHVLANAHHGQVARKKRLVHPYLGIGLEHGLVDDIHIAVLLAEIAAFHHLYTPGAQELPVHGYGLEVIHLLSIATTPSHAQVALSEEPLGISDGCHAGQLLQLHAQRRPLLLRHHVP